MTNGGRLITLVGQSGSGKTTQMRELVEAGFRQSPNITTRPQRPATDLPDEYRYVNDEEYGRLLAQGELLWDVITGNGARYSKERSEVEQVLATRHNTSVNALVPDKAAELVRRYGAEVIKTVWLPSPDDDVLIERMTRRGDSVQGATERIARERLEDWTAQALAIEGLYVVTGITVPDRHREIIDFAMS